MAKGMDGFSEKGNADYALTPGSVLGLRWFWMDTKYIGDPFIPDAPAGQLPVLTGQTGYGYQPGINEAVCRDSYRKLRDNIVGHKVPAGGCGCGFWAYWTPQDANRHGDAGGLLPVLGVIEATGRVIHGERGFRAQKARIAALHPAFTISLELGPGLEEASYKGRTWRKQELTDAAVAAQATMETRLQQAYPDAKVYSSRDAMLTIHKPGLGFLL